MPEDIAREVAAHYDDLDLFYRRIWGEQVHHGLWLQGDETPEEAALGLTRLVGDRLRLEAGLRVCDVGCGYGRTAAELAERFGVSVQGLTLSARQAAVAAERGDPRVEIRCADWLENDLPDASFDAALAVESTEHMPDPARAIAGMARVVKPGGRIVLCCWLRASDARKWETRHLLDPICKEGRLAGMGTERDYLDWLHAAGLEMLDAEDFTRQVEKTWSVCLRRTLKALLHDRDLRRFLMSRHQENRVFAITLLRIRAAYLLGAMRYVVFTAMRP
ncbi:class I SAM-dependent methyltransferase [Haloferula sargassicola]|uniref:27-O-demethylrifamycin SV methyltransferase n=1 Tax=Haloferula sargassicola TaxID=490096 RepID=A0ABP9UM73_9BACT